MPAWHLKDRRRAYTRLIPALLVLALVIPAGVFVTVKHFAWQPDCRIAMFDGGVPGTREATAALDFAASAKIDCIINYSAINARKEVVTAYLDDAKARHVGVMLSIKDMLPPLAKDDLDEDPANIAIHRNYDPAYARALQASLDPKSPIPLPSPDEDTYSSDAEVAGIINLFGHHRAVAGW